MSAQGFEPRTHALEGRCSIQLSYAPKLLWSGKRDSNSRLQPWQGCALPLNYSRSFIKLNKNGADEGSRTPTPMALDPKSSASANSATSAHFLVEDGGFEPPKSMTTDLQSAPFGRSGNPPY